MTSDRGSDDKRIPEVSTVSFLNEDQNPRQVGDNPESPHDFEEAIEAAGYGPFNYLLIISSLPGAWANFFDTTTLSYVLPLAECDLELTIYQKGLLNASIYAGMILTCCFWGILSDSKGRRPLLIVGYLADSICNVLCSMSQNFATIMTFKFVSGCLISGPFAINMSYLTEFHGTKHRSKVLLFTRLFVPLANLVVPVLAWSIIPQSWSFVLLDGKFVYNSWRIFLLISSVPPLLAFVALIFFPESPRFLMSQGRNEEALDVFRKMYAINTGKSKDTFPVKELLREEAKNVRLESSDDERVLTLWDKTRHGFVQIKPLFSKLYFFQFFLISVVQFGSMLSLNTVRLWMPEIFTLMENFYHENRDHVIGSSDFDENLCDIIINQNGNISNPVEINSTISNTAACVVPPVHSQVYINSIIVAVTSITGYAIVANVVNVVGKNNLLLVLFLVPALCSFVVHWSSNYYLTMAIFSVYLALTGIATTTSMNIILELMPTSLRTTALSISLCVGRFGSIVGNVVFPILLSLNCIFPFAFVGSFLIVCFVLSIFISKPPQKLM